jgi:hypothetical protein
MYQNKNYAYFSSIEKFLEMNDDNILSELKKGFISMMHDVPNFKLDTKQENAWRGMMKFLREVFSKINKNAYFAMEYRLPFSNERIDLILFGKNDEKKNVAIIFELKGWKAVDLNIEDQHEHPEKQLKGYLEKLNKTHSTAHIFNKIGVIWAYNLPKNKIEIHDNFKAFFEGEETELLDFLNSVIKEGIERREVEEFLNGEYFQSPLLLDVINNKSEELIKKAYEFLCENGIPPSEDQKQFVENVISEVESGKKKFTLYPDLLAREKLT